MSSPQSLKWGNTAWMASLLIADAVLCWAAIDYTDLTAALDGIVAARSSVILLAAPIILIINALLTPDQKASLVYVRRREALASFRAFSVHAVGDHRIDLDGLRRVVGTFPVDAREQSSKWYQLYDGIRNEGQVLDANRRFLLLRDAASLSLVAATLSPLFVWPLIGINAAGLCSLILLIQYLLCAKGAQNSGDRLVTTVLATASHRRGRDREAG